MFREYTQEQIFLLPPSLEDFIEESHPAHVINDLVEELDLTLLMSRYGDMGQPAYHPKMMMKVILYGFTSGVFSSRKLQRACEENLAFKYLAGMETPAFKTFIEFRKRHCEDMKVIFVETVKLARELGLAKLGAVALDGCKLGADTSKHKAMSYGRMSEEEKKLKEEMELLLKEAEETDARENAEHGGDGDGYHLEDELSRRETRLKKIERARAALEEREKKAEPNKPIDPKKQISFADHDARCFMKRSEGTEYVYNSQAAVDMEHQIIVENHIEDSVSDGKAAETALENMRQDLGKLPDKLVADAGYGNQNTLKSCQERGVTPVCATSREGGRKKSGGLAGFDYDHGGDHLTCPHGRVFELDHVRPIGGMRVYRSREATACGCGDGDSKDGRRTMRASQGYLAKRALTRILSEHRELYKRRKCTVEPVFGQIQVGMGFRRYLYRGTKKVRSEWNLTCAAFNIKKIAALMRAGKVQLNLLSLPMRQHVQLSAFAV